MAHGEIVSLIVDIEALNSTIEILADSMCRTDRSHEAMTSAEDDAMMQQARPWQWLCIFELPQCAGMLP